MNKKKVTKIILFTFLLLLVISLFLYKFYHEKTETNKNCDKLQLKETIHSLQEKTNNILKNLNENTTPTNTETNNRTLANNGTFFTDEQIEIILSNFLELQAHANCDSLLENLTEKGELHYDSSKNIILNDGTILTTIKFSDYKNAMLNYVSENEFEKNWNSTQHFSKNANGYLVKIQGGGGLRTYTIENIIKNNNLTFSAKTTAIVDDDITTKENENFTFTIKSYNGNCVIDSIQ